MPFFNFVRDSQTYFMSKFGNAHFFNALRLRARQAGSLCCGRAARVTEHATRISIVYNVKTVSAQDPLKLQKVEQHVGFDFSQVQSVIPHQLSKEHFNMHTRFDCALFEQPERTRQSETSVGQRDQPV